jgi:predicted butyrate kinase (DUF1464 family)
MPRVVGIDPGTVTIDLCGLDGTAVWLDRTLTTREALADPGAFLALLRGDRTPDLIAGPSGYGLPLLPASQATDDDLALAFLSREGEAGGIGGLRGLARLLRASALPIVFTPGVIHLPSIPSWRKLNRVDMGTADKVAAAVLGVWDQCRRREAAPDRASFILLELGGAFSAALAVESGRIVDGLGGTSGPLGWRSAGAWDGEVAFLAGTVTKDRLFQGGREAMPPDGGVDAGLEAYVESAHKAVLALHAVVSAPHEILLSGRHATDPDVRLRLEPRLARLAPVRELGGFARVAKHGAQGAAILADGLMGGRHAAIVETMGIRGARGTALDHLRVITPADARARLGIE